MNTVEKFEQLGFLAGLNDSKKIIVSNKMQEIMEYIKSDLKNFDSGVISDEKKAFAVAAFPIIRRIFQRGTLIDVKEYSPEKLIKVFSDEYKKINKPEVDEDDIINISEKVIARFNKKAIKK